MSFDLKTCRFVVWGYRNNYSTHSHIHEGIFRALQFMGKSVEWLDQSSDTRGRDWANTLIVTNHDVAWHLPLRDDCFYVVHGFGDHPDLRERFAGIRNRLSWNVFHDFSHVYGTQGNPLIGVTSLGVPLTERMDLDEDTPFYPRERHMDFRWATDLTPPEIEANKVGAAPLNVGSRVINYVGTIWRVNEREVAAFRQACGEGGIEFRQLGAGQSGEEHRHLGHSKVVSVADNVRLVRESYFGPSIVGSHHLIEGYAPCRLFKNISYGHFGVTNSARMQRLFGGRLIHNDDPHRLFFDARERLASMPVSELHALMDFVKERHTYVRRMSCVLKAAAMVMDGAGS